MIDGAAGGQPERVTLVRLFEGWFVRDGFEQRPPVRSQRAVSEFADRSAGAQVVPVRLAHGALGRENPVTVKAFGSVRRVGGARPLDATDLVQLLVR